MRLYRQFLLSREVCVSRGTSSECTRNLNPPVGVLLLLEQLAFSSL